MVWPATSRSNAKQVWQFSRDNLDEATKHTSSCDYPDAFTPNEAQLKNPKPPRRCRRNSIPVTNSAITQEFEASKLLLKWTSKWTTKTQWILQTGDFRSGSPTQRSAFGDQFLTLTRSPARKSSRNDTIAIGSGYRAFSVPHMCIQELNINTPSGPHRRCTNTLANG